MAKTLTYDETIERIANDFSILCVNVLDRDGELLAHLGAGRVLRVSDHDGTGNMQVELDAGGSVVLYRDRFEGAEPYTVGVNATPALMIRAGDRVIELHEA